VKIPYLLLFGLILVSAGCSRNESHSIPVASSPADDERVPVPGDWITYYIDTEPDTLNPVLAQLSISNTIAQYISEPLVQRDPQTFALSPWLAASWEISPDKLIYTFHLRRDVKWDDGAPFTAEDVKFTMDKLLDPKTVTFLQGYFQTIKSYSVLDPYTIRFFATKPYYRLLESFNDILIIPEHAFVKGGDFNSDPFNRHPIGTGPYRFVRWVTGSQVVLERRDDYWGAKAYPKRLLFQLVEQPSTALQLLKKGELDVMDGIAPLRYQRELLGSASMARLNTCVYTQPNLTWLGFNLRRPLFSDVRVRHAIDLLLPRAEMQKMAGGPEFNPLCTGSEMPGTPRYNSAVLPTPLDPVLAGQLLDQAGWKLSPRDGYRYRDGKRLAFTLAYETGGLNAMEVLMQEALQKAGIALSLDGMDGPRLNDELNHWNYDAYFWGWVSDLDDDPFTLWHSSQAVIPGSANCVGYQSREADRLIEQAQVEFDADKRNALYRQLNQVVHDDYPACFLFTGSTIMLVSKRLENVQISQIGYEPFLAQVYIPLSKQKHRDP